ncbi:hypothetical protein L1987_79801 [Smallanthus sonchifolius]|uniref:Uncharacterized protein n=1 Tax=Smallanthus sonchifolius TaxID=185202 RepID=A0ACB8YK59_9ASTR|nr:hypothetical protein L1987_79801 [Smallanthus sonchifolius]
MAGIALLMDLLRKNPSVNGQTLHSTGLYSATIAASSAAAAYVSTNTPFASRALFGFSGKRFAYCDAVEDDDNDFLPDSSDEHHVDLVVPFKKSVKQVLRETSVVTTRRVLERLAVHHFSQRAAWKLLKDVPKSAMRKANRGMPFYTYFFCVSRTTFRGHFLGVAASWLVQVGIECYRFVRNSLKSNQEEDVDVDQSQRVKVLGKKVYGVTVRCGASLVFASIGAGIGATLFRPSTGQSVGCLLGDMAGPIIVSFCFANVGHLEL